MKNKNMVFIILVSLVVSIIVCYNMKNVFAEENLFKLNKDNLMESNNLKEEIKVNFYRWNREIDQREEFVGMAELKEGKLVFDVKDERLKKMLKWDFHTMITAEEDGKSVNKSVAYEVGTIEHLQSVIEHCKDISCVAEIVID